MASPGRGGEGEYPLPFPPLTVVGDPERAEARHGFRRDLATRRTSCWQLKAKDRGEGLHRATPRETGDTPAPLNTEGRTNSTQGQTHTFSC